MSSSEKQTQPGEQKEAGKNRKNREIRRKAN